MTHAAPHDPSATPRPWEWLYALVGAGMWASSRARFDLEIVAGAFPPVEGGQLWVSTHRAETDVPILGGLMYVHGGMWRPGAARAHFAARDDLFEPGVVAAGLRLPPTLARVVWPLTPGRWLPRVRAHPVRRPTGAKLGQLIRDLPDELPLDDILGPRLTALVLDQGGFRRPAPRSVGDIRGPSFARLLWEDVDGDDLTEAGQVIWRRHVARVAGDLRRIARVVRDGHPMVLFPEGRVSPDGAIGPVGDILVTLARVGRAAAIVPVAVAYDPLRPGRTAVAVAVGPAFPPVGADLAGDTLIRLRRLTPVTCGQVLARELGRAADDGRDLLEEWRLRRALDIAAGREGAEGRPVSRMLRDEHWREAALAAALESLRRRGLVTSLRGGVVGIDAAAVRADRVVRRLEAEDRSARATDEPGARSE